MHAYLFLAIGATDPFDGFRWPTPVREEPGGWVDRRVTASSKDQLAYWIQDELWVVELGGDVVEHPTSLVARQGRLVRHERDWGQEVCRELARFSARKALLLLGERGVATGDDAWTNAREAANEAERALPATSMLTAVVALAGWDPERQAIERRWQSEWIVDRLGLTANS